MRTIPGSNPGALINFQMNYYDNISEGYDTLHKEEQIKKLSLIADQDIIEASDSLLDVGCGTGFSLDYFDLKEATGIDPSQGLISQYKGDEKIMLGSAEELPFEDNSFDVVISVTAIQNFDDIKKGLEEIKRVGNDRFVLTFLKNSPKRDEIKEIISYKFLPFHILELEEEKDIVFVIRRS